MTTVSRKLRIAQLIVFALYMAKTGFAMTIDTVSYDSDAQKIEITFSETGEEAAYFKVNFGVVQGANSTEITATVVGINGRQLRPGEARLQRKTIEADVSDFYKPIQLTVYNETHTSFQRIKLE